MTDIRVEVACRRWADGPEVVACAVSGELAAFLREEAVLWWAGVSSRDLMGGDVAFKSAADQCADHIDPHVWQYIEGQ